MRHAVLRLLCFGLAAALGQPLMAAPTVHLFEDPPNLPYGPPKAEPSPGAAPGRSAASAQATVPAAPEDQKGCKVEGFFTYQPGITTVHLDFVRAHFSINNPDNNDPRANGEDPVELRSYGGCKSGPVVRIDPGNTLRFDLKNETNRHSRDNTVVDSDTVDAIDPTCLADPPKYLQLPDGVGCFDTTNLHTHGLHVSPEGNSDNVLLNINPGTRFLYEINVPADHWAGTFWYHAHRHGSTAVQVSSGAAGLLIINGKRPYRAPTAEDPHPLADIDTLLHDAAGKPMKEQLFLLQQIAYACFENKKGEPRWQKIYTEQGIYDAQSPPRVQNAAWTCPTPDADHPVSAGAIENFDLQLDSPTVWDTNGRFTSINGVVQPVLNVPTGEIQRWRFAHGGIHDAVNLQIVRSSWTLQDAGSTPGSKPLLTGNKKEQLVELHEHCKATPETLIPQFEIASDGVTRTQVHAIGNRRYGSELESNYLQPGYRSDILVTFPQDGIYCVMDQAAPAQERPHNGKGGQGPSTPQLLAYVIVQGGKPISAGGAALKTSDYQNYIEQALYDANKATLPEPALSGLLKGDLTPWAPFVELPPANSGAPQQADFVISAAGAFTINGKSYDPDVINITREVNTIDDWTLTAEGEPHIFHIHVNPFEVVDVTATIQNGQQISIFDEKGDCIPMLVNDPGNLANQYCGMHHAFKDTVFVEPGYQVHIRTKYDRYIGEYVIHCHILDHEDAGMMLNVNIVPDINAARGGLGMAMHHHADAGMPAMTGMPAMDGMSAKP